MMFILTTLNCDGNIRKFLFRLDTLEAGLDFISDLIAQNETIVSLHIESKGHLTPLPIEAFDGSLLSAGIQKLEAEWNRILTRPRPTATSADSWIQKRLDRNTLFITQQELFIAVVRQLINQLTDLQIPDYRKYVLTQCYESVLASCERQLISTHNMRKRLSRLAE